MDWKIEYQGTYFNTLLKNLAPLTHYSFQVAAETVAVGPFSEPVVIQTLE